MTAQELVEAQNLDDTKHGRKVRQGLERLHYQIFGEEPSDPVPTRTALTDLEKQALEDADKLQLATAITLKNRTEQTKVLVDIWCERLRERTEALLSAAVDEQAKQYKGQVEQRALQELISEIQPVADSITTSLAKDESKAIMDKSGRIAKVVWDRKVKKRSRTEQIVEEERKRPKQ